MPNLPTTPRTPTLPRLIITPSTPIPTSLTHFEQSYELLPPHSPITSHHYKLEDIQEKPTPSSSYQSNEKRPIPKRSNSLPSSFYLSPSPSPSSSSIQKSRTGKRPLRTPSIISSIIFLVFAFMLFSSTLMCTSSSAGVLLEYKKQAGDRLFDLLKFRGESKGSISIGDLKAEDGLHLVILEEGEEGEEEGKGMGISKGLLDYFWNREEFEWDSTHTTIVSAGPAISLDGGAIWDFDS